MGREPRDVHLVFHTAPGALTLLVFEFAVALRPRRPYWTIRNGGGGRGAIEELCGGGGGGGSGAGSGRPPRLSHSSWGADSLSIRVRCCFTSHGDRTDY